MNVLNAQMITKCSRKYSSVVALVTTVNVQIHSGLSLRHIIRSYTSAGTFTHFLTWQLPIGRLDLLLTSDWRLVKDWLVIGQPAGQLSDTDNTSSGDEERRSE